METIFNAAINAVVTYYLIKWLWNRLDKQANREQLHSLPVNEDKCIPIRKFVRPGH